MCMALVVVTALVAIAGCSGAAISQGPPRATCRSVPLPAGGSTTLYGTVTDRSGWPLAGATVELVRWRDTAGGGGGGAWLRDQKPAQATTDDAGHYAVTTPYGSYRIEAHAAGGIALGMGYRADRASRRLDITIDPKARRIFDAALFDPSIECEWSCPRDHAPRYEWWLQRNACPVGTRLTVKLDATAATSSIACTN